jgi:hypothetical protein
MTVEERSKSVTDEVGTATTGAELRALIAQAINAAVEEVEDRVANERDSYLERIDALEAEIERLRGAVEEDSARCNKSATEKNNT